MQYRHTFINQYLSIKVNTNSKRVHKLIGNFLDFKDRSNSLPKIKIDFYLDEIRHKSQDDDKNFLYQNWPDKNNILLSSLGSKIATVITDPKAGVVKGSILNYQESFKERILDFVFTQPLHFILARHRLFFLHSSVVSKGRDCILIAGPQYSGKSTLALALAQNGFNLLADDDCFVKLVGKQAQLFPFLTKMGLNDKILERYQELKKHTLKNYRYGGKRRISLNAISSSNNIKGLRCKMIIFPKYKADRNMSMEQLSKKEGLDRLAKENLTIYDKERFPKLSINNFKALYNLTRQANSFELTYNDTNLNKIAGAIKKVGNFKD